MSSGYIRGWRRITPQSLVFLRHDAGDEQGTVSF